MKRPFNCHFYRIFPVVCFQLLVNWTTLCHSQSRGGRKVEMLEDIQGKVNTISDWIDSQPSGTKADYAAINSRLASIENHFYMTNNRIDKLVDWIETSKLNQQLLNDRLTKIEDRIKGIEEGTSNKIEGSIVAVAQVSRKVDQLENGTDLKLRKVVNVVNDVYDISKTMDGVLVALKDLVEGLSCMGGRTSSDNPDEDRLDQMQRKVLEKLSITEAAIKTQLNTIDAVGKNTLASCDSVQASLLEIRDDCLMPTGYGRKPTRGPWQDYQSNTNTDTNCLNATSLQKHETEIKQKFDAISSSINTEVGKVSAKLDEFTTSCRAKQQRGITVSNSQDLQALAATVSRARSVIAPVDNPTARQTHCSSTSSLPSPKSCSQLFEHGATCDGIYIIMPRFRAARVYCDMTDNGGGWTVIMRRGEFGESNSRRVSFDQGWSDYKNGFGDLEGEFWLGNEFIHQLTAHANDDVMLQVDLESFDGDHVSIVFDTFKIEEETNNYRLHLGNVIQSPLEASSFRTHNNSAFSTRDRKNNVGHENCARKFGGGWWYHNCHSALLTAPFYQQHQRQASWQGIQWQSWKQSQHLKAAQMKIKTKPK